MGQIRKYANRELRFFLMQSGPLALEKQIYFHIPGAKKNVPRSGSLIPEVGVRPTLSRRATILKETEYVRSRVKMPP